MALFSIASALPACGQAAAAPGSQVLFASAYPAPSEVVREIDDPSTRDRWVLTRDDRYPGGPGRMVLVSRHRADANAAPMPVAGQARESKLLPVIRSGDRLIVEEHTAVADAVLEAVALSPAAAGAAFDARLKIGGRVVRAVALAPGRAALQPETGMRP